MIEQKRKINIICKWKKIIKRKYESDWIWYIQIFRKEILGIEKKKYSKFFKLGKLNQVN